MAMTSKLQAVWAGALLALLPMQGVGAAPKSGDFEGYPVVGNQELAAMRGGFEVNIGGEMLSLAFSLERVTYLNGELQVLSRIVVPDLAAAIQSPRTISATTYSAPPASAVAGASSGDTLIQNGTGNSVALPAQQSQQINAANQQVSQMNQQMNQALQAAQAQILQAQNQVTVIQNSLDNQLIQNMTTLNVTLSNAALARAVELNAGLAQMLNIPIAPPQ